MTPDTRIDAVKAHSRNILCQASEVTRLIWLKEILAKEVAPEGSYRERPVDPSASSALGSNDHDSAADKATYASSMDVEASEDKYFHLVENEQISDDHQHEFDEQYRTDRRHQQSLCSHQSNDAKIGDRACHKQRARS